MTAKHTPGPWHTGAEDIAPCIVYGTNGFAICNAVIHHGKHSESESIANARLIAAAPELLEACHKARALLAGSIPEEDQRIVEDSLRAAIAKATGQ